MMRWSISPVQHDKTQAEVRLDCTIKFKGVVADSMFAVLPDVAASIMERFVRLIEAAGKRAAEKAKVSKAPVVAKPAPAVKANEVGAAPAKRVPKKLEVRSSQAAGGKQPAAG